MTKMILQPVKCYPVAVGGVRLYLSAWKTSGVRVLKEEYTSGGAAGVTASYPKGTRLTLEGKLAPMQDTAAVTAELAGRLAAGTQEEITVHGLCFSGARLCAYTVTEGQGAAEVMLQFHTASCPVLTQEVQEDA